MIRRCMLAVLTSVVCAGAAGAATTTVTVSNFAFTPKDVTIGLHDTVHWTMPSLGFHTVTYGAGSGDPDAGSLFDHGLSKAGDTFDYTFDTAGDYPYFCGPHEGLGMVGTVHVATTGVVPTAWAKIKALYK